MHGGPTGASIDRLRAEVARFRSEVRDGWTPLARTSRAEELLGVMKELDAACTAAVRDADRDNAWVSNGYSSVTSWIAHRGQVSRTTAARYARAVKHLGRFANTEQAFDHGDLSTEHLDRLARVARGREKHFADHEDMLLGHAAEHDLADFTVLTEQWRLYADDHYSPSQLGDCASTANLRIGFDGWHFYDVGLEPAVGAAIERRLRSRMGPPDQDDTQSMAERRAEALADLILQPDTEPTNSADLHPTDEGHSPPATHDDCAETTERDYEPRGSTTTPYDGATTESSGAPHRAPVPGRFGPRVNVDVRVDHEVLTHRDHFDPGHCRSELDGHPIAPSEAAMLCCDSWIGRVIMRGTSQIIDVGSRSRTAPDALRRGLALRDQGCRFPGCAQPPERCDVHHPDQVHHGGETKPENTCLVCPKHHRYIHRNRLFLGVDADGGTELRPESPP